MLHHVDCIPAVCMCVCAMVIVVIAGVFCSFLLELRVKCVQSWLHQAHKVTAHASCSTGIVELTWTQVCVAMPIFTHNRMYIFYMMHTK